MDTFADYAQTHQTNTQTRPLEKISGEIEAVDQQIDALGRKRLELMIEHDTTMETLGLAPKVII